MCNIFTICMHIYVYSVSANERLFRFTVAIYEHSIIIMQTYINDF